MNYNLRKPETEMKNIRAIAEYLFRDLEKEKGYPYEDEIRKALAVLKGEHFSPGTDPVSVFMQRAAQEALREFDELFKDSGRTGEVITEIFSSERNSVTEEKDRIILELLHPEAAFFPDDREKGVRELRRRREIRLTELNSTPISDPAKQIVFTSNFMLTVPVSEKMLDNAEISEELKKEIRSVMQDSQDYWFDHPVPIGTPISSNELIYGLKNLAETLEYEKRAGTCPERSKMKVFISVSVTHRRLKNILHRYMEEELKKASDFKNLDIYFFTENDSEKIIEKILLPAAEKKGKGDLRSLKKVFGVDGEYGRHYSFLKAVIPLWQLLSDPEVRGTFKIDLDQVFPEKELVSGTGKTAFQHLMTPMWGASGSDWKGRKVELGMIAGSLVNEKDIGTSLFKPDVPYPERLPDGEERVFFKQYPMALSTEAEMDLREYSSPGICQMRYHVTGGTNGILLESLRRHRPFTPTFIGRAEDQGYILSVLFSRRNSSLLRYLHQPGLKMRHDKEAFISDAIKTAETGTYIGDLVRILAFSAYSDIVGGNIDMVKEETDPFTGSFISRIPSALVLFRLLLHVSDELKKDKPAAEKHACLEKLIFSASERLSAAFDFFKNRTELASVYEREKEGWELYYDILDSVETELVKRSSFADSLKKEADKIFERCRL